MVDFSKHRKGDVVAVHCCDECARKSGVKPKLPADSGKASWLCDVCGHYGIGSLTDCEIGDWLGLRPLQPNVELEGDTEKGKSMEWTSAETPPEMKTSEWWPESAPVLVHEADGTMRVATYEQVDEDSAPCWYSADSERWTLEKVTHWMPLPGTPSNATLGL